MWIVYALMLLVTVMSASAVNLTNGLVLYWALNETSGTNVSDVSGNNYFGTATNQAIFTGLYAGKINYSADFSTGNYVISRTTAGVGGTDDISIAFWLNLKSAGTSHKNIFYQTSAGSNHRLIYTASNTFYFGSRTSTGTAKDVTFPATQLNFDTWYHIVSLENATGLFIYVNGVLNASLVESFAKRDFTDAFTIGGYPLSTYMDGRMDEFGIWRRSLNSTEISALYNNGSGLSYNDFEEEEEEPEPDPEYFSITAKDFKANISISNFSVLVNGTSTLNTTNGTIITSIPLNSSDVTLQFSGMNTKYFNKNVTGISTSSAYEVSIDTKPRIRAYDINNDLLDEYILIIDTKTHCVTSDEYGLCDYFWNEQEAYYNGLGEYLVEFYKDDWFDKNDTFTFSANQDYNISNIYQAELTFKGIEVITEEETTTLPNNDNITQGVFLKEDYLYDYTESSNVVTSSGSSFQLSKNITDANGNFLTELSIEHASSSSSGSSICSEVYAIIYYEDGSNYTTSTSSNCLASYVAAVYDLSVLVMKRVDYIEVWNRNIHNSYSGNVRNIDIEGINFSAKRLASSNFIAENDVSFIYVIEGYYLSEKTLNITALMIETINFNIHDSIINVYVKTPILNITINDFNLTISQSDNSFNETFSITNGEYSFFAKKGLIYDLFVVAEGYAIDNSTNYATVNLTSDSVDQYFYLFKTNTLDLVFRDDKTKTILSGINITLEMISDSKTYNFTTNDGTIQVELITPENYVLRYNSEDFDEGFYLITVLDLSYNALNLYMINSSQSNQLTVTIIDESANNVEGAVVKLLKYDLLTNSYLVMEIRRTDVSGEAIFNVRKNQEFYKFIVEVNEVVVRSTNPAYITSDLLNIQIFSQGIFSQEFFGILGISGLVTYNNNTGNFRADYNDPGNIGQYYCLAVYQIGRTKTFINETCSESPVATLLLPVTVEEGKIYEASLYVRVNPVLELSKYTLDLSQIFNAGNMGLLIQILLTIFFAFTFIYSPSLSLIMTPMSLIIGRILQLNSLDWYIITPLIIIGGIIAYLLETRR